MQEFDSETLTAALHAARYDPEAVDDALMASYLDENKLLHIWEIRHFPEGRVLYELDLTMDWNFARLDQARMSFLDVSIENQMVAGIVTASLDKRMEAHDWQYYYSFLLPGPEKDKGLADEHAILQDLYALHQNGDLGRDMAEKLLVRHVAHELAWKRYPDLTAAAKRYERRWLPEEIPSIPLGYQMAINAPITAAPPHDLSGFFERIAKEHQLELKQPPMYLETKYAQSITDSLERAIKDGERQVVFAQRPSEAYLHPMDLHFFADEGEALDFADDMDGMAGGLGVPDRPVYCIPAERLLELVNAANPELALKTNDMNLGTPNEAMETLLEKGYHENIALRVGAGLADFNDSPIWSDKYALGPDKLYIEWEFSLRDGDRVHHGPLTIHLLHVPIKQEVLQGIDTRELDKRMAAIDWNHPNLSREALTAMVDINKLSFSNDERSENAADRLAVKHWSWAAPNEGNLSLEEKKQEFLVSKSYHDLPKLSTAYRELTELNVNKLSDHLNEKRMNLNNLEDLKNELQTLKFSPDVAAQLEAKMRPLPNYFVLKDQLPGDQGPVNFTLHFKKSNQSDFYNMGKVDVTAGKEPVLPPDQTYMVITQDPEKEGKSLTKHFDNAADAVEFFKKQKGTSELGVGPDADSKQLLASKENGKDIYLNREFAPVFTTPPVRQTFYPEKGYGFTAEQCANMVQGRTVYRPDLMTRLGEPYAAWVKLDFEQAKDDYGNRRLNNYHDPKYGFDMNKTLDRYQIKELADPAQRAELIKSLEAGNRTEITTLKDGKEVPMKIDLSARYSSLDFFDDKGRREKREQFEKPTHLELGPKKDQAQKEDQQQSKGRKR